MKYLSDKDLEKKSLDSVDVDLTHPDQSVSYCIDGYSGDGMNLKLGGNVAAVRGHSVDRDVQHI